MTYPTILRRGTAASKGMLLGQSNAAGNGGANPTPTKAVENVLYNQILGDFQPTYGANGRVSVEPLLAPHRSIYKHGDPGTSISQWISTLLPTSIATMASLAWTPDWVIWIQGESDATSQATADAYETRWRTLLDTLYGEYGTVAVFDALLSGLPAAGYPAMETVNAAKMAVATDPAYDVTTLATDSYPKQGDQVHYERVGYDAMCMAFRGMLVGRGL